MGSPFELDSSRMQNQKNFDGVSKTITGVFFFTGDESIANKIIIPPLGHATTIYSAGTVSQSNFTNEIELFYGNAANLAAAAEDDRIDTWRTAENGGDVLNVSRLYGPYGTGNHGGAFGGINMRLINNIGGDPCILHLKYRFWRNMNL